MVNELFGCKITTIFRHMQGLGDFFCIMERDFLGLSDEEDLHGDG